jgi:hypothetical protein
MAHRIVTVSEVVDVAVILTVLYKSLVVVDCVTPAEKVSVAVLGILNTMTPEPPVPDEVELDVPAPSPVLAEPLPAVTNFPEA